MLRSLLSFLAIVAIILAAVLKTDELFFAAGALAIIVVVSWIVVGLRRHREAKRDLTLRMKAPAQPDEQLASFGILEIRPKDSTQTPKGGEAPEPTASERGESPHVKRTAKPGFIVQPDYDTRRRRGFEEGAAPGADPSPQDQDDPSARLQEFVAGGNTKGSTVGTAASHSSLPDAHDEAVLGPFLEGIRAALNAHAACVLRRRDDTEEYQILGISGKNWAMKPGEMFRASTAFLNPGLPVALRRIADKDLPPRCLGYSATPGSITQVLVASVGATPLLLLADSTQKDGLAHPRIPDLFEQFARTIALLLYDENPTRPRREIIAEEMARARAQGLELALAIVVLNQAESVAALGETLITEAEAHLRQRLQSASASSRIVRFGELMFGVFTDGERTKIEAWHEAVQASLGGETGLLNGGVSIGVAILRGRHASAEDLREDATQALLQAYNTGTRTVLA